MMIVAAIAAFSMVSCSSPQTPEELETYFKGELPYEMGDGMKMTDAKWDAGAKTFTVVCEVPAELGKTLATAQAFGLAGAMEGQMAEAFGSIDELDVLKQVAGSKLQISFTSEGKTVFQCGVPSEKL